MILYVLIALTAKSVSDHFHPFWNETYELFFLKSSFYLALLAMGFTLISGVAYLFDLKRSLKNSSRPTS